MSARYNRIIAQLQRKLTRLITDMLKSGASDAEIKRAAQKLIRDFNPYRRLSQQFADDANKALDEVTKQVKSNLTWIAQRTRLQPSKKALSILTQANKEFAIIGGKIKKGIIKALDEAINSNMTKKQLAKSIEKSVSGAYRAETIARTSLSGYSSAISIEEEREAGVKKWTYKGQSPERAFCKEHYNKTYTYEEIQAMDNQQNLDVRYFKGGWNCNHKWRPVIDDELLKEKGII